MKTFFDANILKYDGTQLAPLRNYLQFGLLGDSVVSWVGPCEISFAHMMDGEDLREKSPICGSKMLHLVFEIFDASLIAGVCLQRLTADLARALIAEKTKQKFLLTRKGDDLYDGQKKLSISIAIKSVNSVLIHFAMNISNEGTPVETCCLQDFSLSEKDFAIDLMKKISEEWISIREATWKVRSLV